MTWVKVACWTVTAPGTPAAPVGAAAVLSPGLLPATDAPVPFVRSAPASGADVPFAEAASWFWAAAAAAAAASSRCGVDAGACAPTVTTARATTVAMTSPARAVTAGLATATWLPTWVSRPARRRSERIGNRAMPARAPAATRL